MDDFTRALMQLLAYLKDREDQRLDELRQIFGPKSFIEGVNFEQRRQGEFMRSMVGAFGVGMGAMMVLIVALVLICKALGARLAL